MTTEFLACRAPECAYKAPTCDWGYCHACCKKHHTQSDTGLVRHLAPPNVGFRLFDNTRHRTITTTEATAAPQPGEIEEVDEVDLPVVESTSYYQSF